MGVNVVEREGISVAHPAHFILVGTMNPEEGELRPQLLDRFGRCVDVGSLTDIDDRLKIIALEDQFFRDPAGLRASALPAEAGLALSHRRRDAPEDRQAQFQEVAVRAAEQLAQIQAEASLPQAQAADGDSPISQAGVGGDSSQGWTAAEPQLTKPSDLSEPEP